MNLERTTDALLSNNLPPNLAKLDHKAENITIGKSSLQTAFKSTENKQFIELQKQRIRYV